MERGTAQERVRKREKNEIKNKEMGSSYTFFKPLDLSRSNG